MWVYEEDHPVHEDDIHKAFRLLDEDNSGTIDEHEIRQVAAEVGMDISHEEALGIINQLDKNHHGEVCCEECDETGAG